MQVAGARKLIEGFAFSAGFFFVVLSEAVLFTEANVVMPATLLSDRRIWPRVLRFWAPAWMGNLAGAWLFGNLIALAQMYPSDVLASLATTVDGKMAHQQLGGDLDWPTALGWNIIPAGIGNTLGAATLVAVPYWYVFRRPLDPDQQPPRT